MPESIAGSWKLRAWRRIEGEQISYPLGRDATGLLIYAEDGTMAVQMTAADRPTIDTNDALGGTADERAAAYSTCLAYFGTWRQEGDHVIHQVEASLFPNWSHTSQSRPFSYNGRELVLRTPPVEGPHGTIINEMAWIRL